MLRYMPLPLSVLPPRAPQSHSLQTSAEFNEVKSKVKLVQRRLNRNSEPQASIESGSYTYQYAPPRLDIRDLPLRC
jgi:hypothetical protein